MTDPVSYAGAVRCNSGPCIPQRRMVRRIPHKDGEDGSIPSAATVAAPPGAGASSAAVVEWYTHCVESAGSLWA